MARMSLSEMENYINIIRDETVDGSELETLVDNLYTTTTGLPDIWNSSAATAAYEDLEKSILDFKKAKHVLNNNGAVITEHANRLIAINSN